MPKTGTLAQRIVASIKDGTLLLDSWGADDLCQKRDNANDMGIAGPAVVVIVQDRTCSTSAKRSGACATLCTTAATEANKLSC